jgi:chloramphenicol O-acetyltransferase
MKGRLSVSDYAVFVNSSLVSVRSKMKENVLSVTKAELVAATQCAQEIL